MIKIQEIRINRIQAIAISAIFIVFLSQIFSAKPEIKKYSENISPTICPSEPSGVNSVVYLSAKKRGVATIKKGERKFKAQKTSSISMGSEAKEIEGLGASPLLVAVKPQSWIALSQCTPAISEKWFVGGISTISSIGYFQFVNPNRSKAVIDLEIWSEDGKESNQSLVISSQSTRIVQLNSLITDKKFLAFHLIARAGRFSAVLFDERKKGLKALGADFVAPVGQARKQVVIPAISGLFGKLSQNTNSVSHTLSLLVPSSIDANVDISVNSDDGKFIPVGLSQLNIKSQRVFNVPLAFAPTNQPFSLIIESDQPILASVLSNFSYGKSSEIAWATGADELSKWSVNLTGSKPTLTFVGERIDIQISATGTNGKKFEKKLTGSNFLVWRAPVGLNKLEVLANRNGISGGVIFLPEAGGIGSSYIPMNNGANLETASEPVSDARVISRG